jgi:excisionase family DNA binding protein
MSHYECMQTPETAVETETVETAFTRITDAFMPVAEAALALGCSTEYLYAGLRDGRFPGIQFGRARMIRREVVNGFVAVAVEQGMSIRFEDYAASWTPATRHLHTNVIREATG